MKNRKGTDMTLLAWIANLVSPRLRAGSLLERGRQEVTQVESVMLHRWFWAPLRRLIGVRKPPRVLLLTDCEPCELAAMELPRSMSSWRVAVGGGPPSRLEEPDQTWSTGAIGTFRPDGKIVSTVGSRGELPVRVWLESRAGAVRVMVANTDPMRSAFVRFDGFFEAKAAEA